MRSGVEFRVVKNTLARRSIKGTPAEELEQYFDGPTALAISRESENLSAKILVKFAEEYEAAPKLKAGVVEGKVIDATEVLALAKLPSKEELMSKLLGEHQVAGQSSRVRSPGIAEKPSLCAQRDQSRKNSRSLEARGRRKSRVESSE